MFPVQLSQWFDSLKWCRSSQQKQQQKPYICNQVDENEGVSCWKAPPVLSHHLNLECQERSSHLWQDKHSFPGSPTLGIEQTLNSHGLSLCLYEWISVSEASLYRTSAGKLQLVVRCFGHVVLFGGEKQIKGLAVLYVPVLYEKGL